MAEPLLSIVVPAGPGDGAWAALLATLPDDGRIERLLVMAEGDIASVVPEGTRMLHAPRGRARQINAGIGAARGQTIWVLHADSVVDECGWHSALDAAETFATGATPALCWFALRFIDGPRRMALNAWGANVRSRLFGMPFGDQGFLAPKAMFEALGGFDVSITRGEDHAFVWAARRAGIPLRRLKGTLGTSARRYIEQGWWRTTREHLALSWQQRRAFGTGAAP